jgi:hypothetical protein
MANLSFSETESLYSVVSKYSGDIMRNLSYARSECAMYVPKNFSCMNFLKSLPSTIDSYHKEFNSICRAASAIDSINHQLLEVMHDTCKNIDTSLIESRERLIK